MSTQKTSSAFRMLTTIIIPWGLFFASVLPLVVLAYLGTFTRYLADDYSTAGTLLNMGFWKAQTFWYQAWSGRFSFTFIICLVELAGVRIVPWLPITGLFLWTISLYWTLRQLFNRLDLQISQIWTGILANIIVFSTIKSFREYSQVIFWQTGILTYQISIIFITLMLGVFLKRFWSEGRHPLARWEYAAWFFAFFVGGGFSETWVIVQIALTGLGLFAFALTKKSPLRNEILSVLFLGFLASGAALMVIAKSPGNMNRDTIMAELSFDLLRVAIQSAFLDLPRFLSEWASANTSLVLILFLTGMGAGMVPSRPGKMVNHLRLGLILVFGAYLLLWAGFVPQYAVMGIRPAERAIFMPMFLFLLAIVLLGVFSGSQLSSRLPALTSNYAHISVLVILATLVIWVPVRAAVSYASLVPDMRLYAQLWDQRDLFLRKARSQGETDFVAPSLRRNPALHNIQSTFWIEGDLQDLSDHWINQMAAAYYGLKAISLRR